MTAQLPPTACPDWAARLQKGQMPINLRRLPVRTAQANKLAKYFRQLRVSDIPGQPNVGDLSNLGWIENSLRAIGGGPEIREALISTPKKSWKTGGFSLAFLTLYLCNSRPRHPFTIVAPSVSIAKYSFDAIAATISADRDLELLYPIKNHVREIHCTQTGSVLAVKSATLESVTGLMGSVFVDEAATLAHAAVATKLRAQLRGALMSNPDAKIITVSTSSDSALAELGASRSTAPAPSATAN